MKSKTHCCLTSWLELCELERMQQLASSPCKGSTRKKQSSCLGHNVKIKCQLQSVQMLGRIKHRIRLFSLLLLDSSCIFQVHTDFGEWQTWSKVNRDI